MMTFLVAHMYLLLLASLGVMAWSDTAIFSFPAAVHILYYRTVARPASRTALVDYRRLYRLAFAASSSVFVFGRILSFV